MPSTYATLFLYCILCSYVYSRSFHIYNTEYFSLSNSDDNNCIYHYESTENGKGRHLVSYCIRPEHKIEKIIKCYGTSYTFAKLYQMNISGNDLFLWFAPIDLINDYELFVTEQESDYALKEYCNCSSIISYGSYCQYDFGISLQSSTYSFDIIINKTFSGKYKQSIHDLDINKDVTCFILFNCTSNTGLCLDWREICNGRFDCINGEDEINCLEIEFNECDIQTEYRCRNGMCIPKIFSFDLTMDCLDYYDEQERQDLSHLCYFRSSADCDEHHCGRLGSDSFSCGDGSCLFDKSSLKECNTHRRNLQLRHVFTYDKQLYGNQISPDCISYVLCELEIFCLFKRCSNNNKDNYCESLPVDEYVKCLTRHADAKTEYFFFPPGPFIYPFVRLLYRQHLTIDGDIDLGFSLVICINASISCDMSQFIDPDYEEKEIVLMFKQFKCYINLKFQLFNPSRYVIEDVKKLVAHCVFPNSTNYLLPNAYYKSAFICKHHLGISYHRIHDGHSDCSPIGMDEESIKIDSYLNFTPDRFICYLDKTIPRRFVADHINHCHLDELFPVGCTNNIDCQFLRDFNFSHQIPLIEFSLLCDGYIILDDDNDNNTDETDCEQWPCLSRATRCDGTWNRPNGCDELNCPLSLPSAYIAQRVGQCKLNEHYCLSYNSTEIKCLPVEKANDGIIDCLFASDERWIEGSEYGEGTVRSPSFYSGIRFRCTATNPRKFIAVRQLCNCHTDCRPGADDELICPWQYSRHCSSVNKEIYFICKNGTQLVRTKQCNKIIDCIDGEDEWGCDFDNTMYPYRPKPFGANKQSFSSLITYPMKRQINNINNREALFYCHRGVLIKSKENNDSYCLCPPSFFGSRCQYQSERLTISFDSEILRSKINLNTIYQLVFYLINENTNKLISLETFVYAPIIHSSIKHLIYLTYPREYLLHSPHNRQSGKIFLHVDAYAITHTSVEHSLSWRYLVQFPFLPVNRLAFRLVFQEARDINQIQCNRLGCKNGGICQTYVNIPQSFCRCPINWFGLTCENKVSFEKIKCSKHSKHLTLYNYSLCLCPLGHTGHNCLVKYDACSNVHCLNNGSCVSGDDRTKEYICQCSREYYGKHCDYKNARLNIHISKNIDFIPVLNILMLHLPPNVNSFLMYRNGFFYKNIQSDNNIIIIEENQRFLSMFIFAQIITNHNSIYGNYYLLNYTNTGDINELNTSLVPEKRCPHISEYLDEEILNYPWLKRVKYYHKYFKNVQCFYDEYYMCFIDEEKLPECFHFNHAHSNCSYDRQYCENGGRCFQHKEQHTGEISFACICPNCFSGSFCQLDMNQFSWTLDSLLAEIILSDLKLINQPLFIKIILSFILILYIIGLISNFASFLTFIQSQGRQVGAGYYLLSLSIISPITLSIFLFRLIHLFISQISVIENDRFLSFGCSTLDFLLSFLISICDWLTACLTCERTASVIKGIGFNRQQSIRIVKIVIPLLIIVLASTSSHQLFSRHLINDPRNEARRWCLIKYQYQWIQTYDITLKLINSTVPFLVNLISAIVLLVIYSQTKQRVNKKQNYSIIFVEQIRQHKHLIFSPLIMIAFKLPLFLVQFSFKCITVKWQLYLSIIVYIISFIPLATTFILFVWLSPSYYKLFIDKWIKRKIKS